MGAWNTQAFGNDDALDWLATLEKAKDITALTNACTEVLNTSDPPDTTASACALAAATVICAARFDPTGRLPSDAKRWIVEHGIIPSNELVSLAISAVTKVSEASELRDLWEETPSFGKWISGVRALIAKLEEALESPVALRKPKAPSARMSLDKLMARIDPKEESPLRDKLRQRLLALPDPSAPINHIEEGPLKLAAQHGLLAETRLLLDRGAEPNPQPVRLLLNIKPLIAACAHGHTEVASLLIERGAKIWDELLLIKIGSKFCGEAAPGTPREKCVEYKCCRALWAAVRSGNVDTVRLLLDHGADVAATSTTGDSLLHTAADANHAGMIRFLLGLGLDINSRRSGGWTPLHWAAMFGKSEAARQLLALGADAKAKDDSGDTARDVAKNEAEIQQVFAKYNS